MDNIFDNTFLNSLFTSDEFDFIAHMDADFDTLQKKIDKMQLDRNVIVKLINNLNDTISFKQKHDESDEQEQDILKSTKNAFELINYNIDALQSNIDLSRSIKKHLVDILIRVDDDGKNIPSTVYKKEIVPLKKKVNDTCKKLDTSNARIEKNDAAIIDFFNIPSVQEYINKFSIEYIPDNTSLPKHSPKVDKNEESTLENIPDVNELYTSSIEPMSNDNNTMDPSVEYTSNTNNEDISAKSETIFETDNNPNVYLENNNLLLVSEKNKRVYLPYSKAEVLAYLEQFPEKYRSFDDVVNKEFIFSTDSYLKHPVIARFREAYTLIRDKEAKSVLDALKYAMDVMFNYDLNPVIIAACKSQSQLEHYMACLAENDLSKFQDFEIKFEITPLV